MEATSVRGSVVDLFTAQALARGDAAAVHEGTKILTYSELDCQSNSLGRFLRGIGVSEGCLVGICMPRSLDRVVGMLAIWKAGGAYLPIDPTNPVRRVASILEDSGTQVVLGTPSVAEKLEPTGCQVVLPSMVPGDHQSRNPLWSAADPDDLAYVIYTSGSTGAPKGVEIAHSALANLVRWHQQAFSITPADRATHLAGLSFDAAIWEVWPYLASGASVHLVDEATRNSPELLRDWLVKEGITVSFAPTPVAERLLTLSWPDDTPLRILLTGGDILRNYPPTGLPFAVVNNYGPTECTIVATSATIDPKIRISPLPPIGRPISNTEVYVLDKDLQVVPPGADGEICIAGVGLARGYRNLANLTAKKFVDCRLGSGKMTRIYRTGDLGRILPDGQIEFLGRLDAQIKIRGYRIEPNEIMNCLNQHPAVRQSLVVAREQAAGDKQLIAYLVLAPDAMVTNVMLIDFLRTCLPDYMIPSGFVRIETFPLTPNGKIDRDALPLVEPASPSAESPQTPIEESVAGIIADLLSLPEVCRDDNFFLLGGHSLLGAQLITRLRAKFRVEISLRTLFDASSVRALSAEIESRIASDGIQVSRTK